MAGFQHILVLGATGASGLAFCYAALREDCRLTLLVRNPSKLPKDIAEHRDVAVLKGEFNDMECLTKAAQCGAKVLVSMAGPLPGSKGLPITDCYRALFPLMQENNFHRALCLSTPSFIVPEDKGSMKWSVIIMGIKTVAKAAYLEIIGLSEYVASIPTHDELRWTIYRVPFLTNSEAKPVRASYIGSGEDGITLSRKSMAEWVLHEMQEMKWIGHAPLISN